MSPQPAEPTPPRCVLDRWHGFDSAQIDPVHAGLINATFLLTLPGEKVILQRLHPIFSPEVNLDLLAVSEHLAAKGLTTPRLLPADDGAAWVNAEDGTWRALTYVPGITHHHLTGPAMALEAGRLVGRFHGALADFDYTYRSGRSHVHDTPAHLERLRQALGHHDSHRLFGDVAPLAEVLFKEAETLESFDHLPLRHAHGDLKISNIMFDAQGHAICLIDLDTLTRMPWPLEMGDALRSWCNPAREDQNCARFDLTLFHAAAQGYAKSIGRLIGKDEWEALVPGVARICLELSSRFLADALNENYFGWDADRYPSRGEHNLARALAMSALYREVLEKRGAAERLVADCRRWA